MSTLESQDELDQRLALIPTELGEYGTDPFGFDPRYVRRFLRLGAWMYRSYFRCATHGVDNIPDGACLVVANHSGQLPFDAAMLTMAVFLERDPPRFLRAMVERFVPSTPFVSTFLARSGQILGTPDNCRRLLQAGAAVLDFPEGVRGLSKTWRERYQLQRFGQGFMRMAVGNSVPIVPAVVIGAEEQAPSFANLKVVGKWLGFPAFPITPTHPWLPLVGMLPLPTRYRIYFGAPMIFTGDANDDDAVMFERVEQVRSVMQDMLERGLAQRRAIFW